MFTQRFKSMLTSPVSPGRSGRQDIPDRQRVHPLWLALVLYSLLLQHFPLTWLTPPVRTHIRQEGSTAAPPKLHLQYTSAGHVLGFGASQVVVGHPTHALTMTLVDAKPVNPTAEPGQLPSDSSESFHLRHPGERRGPESPKTPDTGFRRYDSQMAKAIHSDRAQPFTGSVTYANPWPGVSVIYRAQAGTILKSEYRLAPGFSAKTINRIRIRYNRPIKLDLAGRLMVAYALGNMQESAPVAWQIIDGQQVPVQVRYRLRGKQEVGFAVKDYDPKHALIIDPDLVWNTFLGRAGSETDQGYGIAVDSEGNSYITGYSDGVWDSTPLRPYTAVKDGFAAKLDKNGNLLWHTFLGGAGEDYGQAVCLDPLGNVYITGSSEAAWGSPITPYHGATDAFVAKLNTSGQLIWNTFLGGSFLEYGQAIAFDPENSNLVISGFGLGAWGVPVRAYTGGWDAYTAMLTNDGQLLWNTFIGGTGTDYGLGVTVDDAGTIYVVGHSDADWGSAVRPFTSGQDAFAVQLSETGILQWNTFLGGSGYDHANAVAADVAGNVYIAGNSSASWGSPIISYAGNTDAFSVKLDNTGALLWQTFLGGTSSDYGQSIVVNDSGYIFYFGDSDTGWGSPIRAYTSGLDDAFAAKLDSAGNLLWHTFLGSDQTDSGSSIGFDAVGNLFVVGISSGSWETPVHSYFSGDDVFVAGLDSSGNLLWNTFLGNAGADSAGAIAMDAAGYVYVAGSSSATWGSPLNAHSGDLDAFVAKLSPDGLLQWNTFFGGAGLDTAEAIALDVDGNILVGGSSMAAWGTPVRAFTGYLDAFVVKLSSLGTVEWNSFIGGIHWDLLYDMSLNPSTGQIYICGNTNSFSWGTPVRPLSGGFDAFVAKLGSDGNLLWNTFLGSMQTDMSYGLAVDGEGSVFTGGISMESWGSPVRAFTDSMDGFVAKLDDSGNLLWNSFLGGTGSDSVDGLAADGNGYCFLVGSSSASWGSPIRNYTAQGDAFAAKMNASGTLQWITFLGGSGADSVDAAAVDAQGNLYATGSSDLSWGSPERPYDQGYDAYAVKLDPGGDLRWHSFFGGQGDDRGEAIAVDKAGVNYWLSGISDDSWGVPIHAFGGQTDVGVVKISDLPPLTPTPEITPGPEPDFTPAAADFFRIISPLARLSRGERIQVRIHLDQEAVCSISIYNLTGRKVAVLGGERFQGERGFDWDGGAAGSGIYYVYAESGHQRARGKIALIR